MSDKKYTVNLGVFSGKIHAGVIDRDGKSFADKSECTEDALWAVAGWLLNTENDEVYLPTQDGQALRISIEKVEQPDDL